MILLLQLPFCSPTGVASNVENMWLCMPQNDEKLDLSEVLWLNCGAAGMKVIFVFKLL